MEILAGIITTLFGLYLITLLIVTLLRKKSAINYFSSFASSAKVHYFEFRIINLLKQYAVL